MVLAPHSDQLPDAVLLMDRQDLVLWKGRGGWLSWLMSSESLIPMTRIVTAFKERFSLGALLAFLVTVAEVPLLNVGAAFWGLVSGFAISWLLERSDFAGEGS
jgi:hypothetical protein